MKLTERVIIVVVFSFLFLQTPLNGQNKINQMSTEKQGSAWTWQSLGSVLGNNELDQILVDPEDDAVWYVTSIEKGLYVTRDSGATWVHAISGNGLDAEGLQIDPANPDIVYAAVWDKLYKSIDRGKNWSVVYTCPEYIRSVLVSRVDGSIYLGPQTEQNSSPGIYKSTDGGQNFSVMHFGVSTHYLICWDIVEDSANNVIYVSTELADHPQPYNPPLFRSSNGGSTWDNIAFIGWHAQKMAVDNADGFVYFLKEGGGFYKSSDSGDTWKLLNAQSMMYFLLDPNNPNRIFGSDYQDYGSKCAWMSENRGRAFSSLGLEGLKVTSININKTGTKLYASTWGAGLWTADVPEYVSFNAIRVANTNDSGLWSLREAVNLANNGVGPDTIRFDIPKSDPGYDASSGTWTIVSAEDQITISDDSLFIDGESQKENIGEDTNTSGPEVVLTASTSDIQAGLYITSAYNHISHLVVNGITGSGIAVMNQSAHHNLIEGCFLGTDGTGETCKPNQFGIYIYNSADNQIGAQDSSSRNIISGNSNHGVVMSGPQSQYNLITGNYIGLTPAGEKRGNGSYGVFIGGSASDNAVTKNEIAYNAIGVTVWDSGSSRNKISQNSIYGNLSNGILIYTGANGGMQPPVLNVNGNVITGVTQPGAAVELFSDKESQGEKYEDTVTADANGDFEWSANAYGPFVTATATDALGNTSAFSAPVSALSGGEIKIIIVTTTSETGSGSITEAMHTAKNLSGSKCIKFNIPKSDQGYDAGTGVWKIRTTQKLYVNTDSLYIDGRSQKAFIGEDCNPHGPEIMFSGELMSGIKDDCFFAREVNRFNVYDLIISGYSGGINMTNVNGGTISGCYIGSDPSGMDSIGNVFAVYLTKSSDITVGFSDSSGGNLCFGSSQADMYIDFCSNIDVTDNIFGLNRALERSCSSYHGAAVAWHSERINFKNNTVGGSNVGLSLYQDSLSFVTNNLFNVSQSWEKIGNLNTGVWLTNGSHDNSVKDNKIGFCELYGIALQEGAVRNRLSRNLLTGNDFTGIYLSLGTNNNISAPVITAALSDKVEGHAGQGNVIEIFNDNDGQAKEYIGKTTADNAGNFSLALSLVPVLSNITATATDADSNTSALSAPMKISETGIEDPAKISELRYYLRQNFPNPFNPSTTISFGLAQSGLVDIRVYNLRGEEVAELLHKVMHAGTYRVVFDGSSLATGVYLVRLCAGKFESIEKILLVR